MVKAQGSSSSRVSCVVVLGRCKDVIEVIEVLGYAAVKVTVLACASRAAAVFGAVQWHSVVFEAASEHGNRNVIPRTCLDIFYNG